MAKSDSLYDHPRSKPKGRQEAKKGDRRHIDKEIDGVEFKGEYESIGIEGREEGDPDKIDPADDRDASRKNDAWRKGGKKGPVPTFKSPPKKEDIKKEGDFYEIFRRREEKPTS